MAFDRRCSGVLLHPTSLPGRRFHGVLGNHANRFVRFLKDAGFSVWQTLPLGPTHEDLSPYNCLSVFACNPHLVSVAEMAKKGWLKSFSVSNAESLAGDRRYLGRMMQRAYEGFIEHGSRNDKESFEQFQQQEQDWLDDFALYMALRNHHEHKHWREWPLAIKMRDADALAEARKQYANEIQLIRFQQYVINSQWLSLKAYANSQGIQMFGDMPIYVAYDSAEVWAHPELFQIDDHGQLDAVAGVPPDYFSEDGQLWGNPLYDWQYMEQTDFQWWKRRIARQLSLYDIVRIDHFRGFEAYWKVPGDAQTARDGEWVKAPGDKLFASLHKEFPDLPVVAEDLGVITDEVTELRTTHNMPGMRVLQFGFDGDPGNPHLPENYQQDCIAYTGTHDNNTSMAWFDELNDELRDYVMEKVNHQQDSMPWPLIQTVLESTAIMAVIPLQDILALGVEHRMNMPGVAAGNWRWRFQWQSLDAGLPARLKKLNANADRLAKRVARQPSRCSDPV